MRVPREQTQSGSFSRVREEPGNEAEDFEAPSWKFASVRKGESLFTFFASLAYVPLFLLELQNRLF